MPKYVSVLTGNPSSSLARGHHVADGAQHLRVLRFPDATEFCDLLVRVEVELEHVTTLERLGIVDGHFATPVNDQRNVKCEDDDALDGVNLFMTSCC